MVSITITADGPQEAVAVLDLLHGDVGTSASGGDIPGAVTGLVGALRRSNVKDDGAGSYDGQAAVDGNMLDATAEMPAIRDSGEER